MQSRPLVLGWCRFLLLRTSEVRKKMKSTEWGEERRWRGRGRLEFVLWKSLLCNLLLWKICDEDSRSMNTSEISGNWCILSRPPRSRRWSTSAADFRNLSSSRSTNELRSPPSVVRCTDSCNQDEISTCCRVFVRGATFGGEYVGSLESNRIPVWPEKKWVNRKENSDQKPKARQ